jgi:AraC family transcriptional regulator of adaptative response/methylated-DNA-[protein]-cysteine methyltransferase
MVKDPVSNAAPGAGGAVKSRRNPAADDGTAGSTGDGAQWAAVVARDGSADGQFVYAVRTTGVYCRPSCPSRTARRENVRFFETTHAARAAGFRACKRCRPDAAPLALQQADAVLAACRALEASDSGIALAALAAAAGLSAHHFHRVFKRVTGVTPKAYFRAVQTRRVQSGLPAASSVTEAIYASGYNSAGRFYGSGAAALGMAPLAYRAGGAGQSIAYAVESCSLGQVIVAATARGVCAIELGDAGADLGERLRRRFPKAHFTPGDADFRRHVAQVLAYIEHPQGLLDLPLDVQGTVFQQRVWQALRAIPSGRTISYAELAGAIGRPGAARAVAQACASNPLAVAVPCHRVVRGDGALSGYRWGVERKAELLRREAREIR